MQWFFLMLQALRCVTLRLWRSSARRVQPAQGLVEYGLVLVLIAIFAVGAVTLVGKRMSTTYHQIDCGLRDARMGSPSCN